MKGGERPREPRFHVKRAIDEARRIGVTLEEGQAARLAAFGRLLVERAVPLGMVATSDAPRMLERHLIDSLRAAVAFGADDRLAYDLGSGAGLPGIPLAIALPHVRFLLCEARERRGAFIELAIEALGLANAEASVGRIEDLEPGADVATARGYAPLQDAWRLARRLLAPRGRLVYFAGESLRKPLLEARKLLTSGEEAKVVSSLASTAPLVIMSRK